MTNINHKQREWLENAPIENLKQFLCNGEPGVERLYRDGVRVYYPTLRGVVVRPDDSFKKNYEYREDALEVARRMKEKLKEDTKHLPPLDEKALGIEGIPIVQMKQAEEFRMRIVCRSFRPLQ